ncbi:MAG: hypothetical protein NC225_03085 [Clostridium sp.]|nr:hypothetical protein [Clostridium sp.]MCM1398449.1 hypothetical protein [Clostridium sp.]MCM1460171.1 hypothetical protein [Bacteroides sp.]
MRRIKKTIFVLSLAAAMVWGEAGTAFAAEAKTEIETDYEVTNPQLDKAGPASLSQLDVADYNGRINISFAGNGSKFKVYVNDKLYETVENTENQASNENPAPSMSIWYVVFNEALPGGSYTIKVVPCSYSVEGDVEGTPASKVLVMAQHTISNLQVSTNGDNYNNKGYEYDATGYRKPYVYITWDRQYYDYCEIWRRESGAAWKKIGSTGSGSYRDKTVVAGKKYQYRVRIEARKNDYVSVPAGAWLTAKSQTVSVASVYVSLNFVDNVTINMSPNYDGAISGYEIWRSTKKTKGYKKIATVGDNTYTDKDAKKGTYYYKVRGYYYDTATGKKGYGKFSDVKSVKLTLGSISVSARQTGKKAAKVEWNQVVGAQKYEVWYRTSLSGDAWRLYKTTTGLSCKLSGLTNDVGYYFMVKAIRGSGKNTYTASSNVYCFIGFKEPKPEVVKTKVTTSKSKDKVTLKTKIKWDRVYGASKIRIVGGKDGKEKTLKTLKGTATSYTLTTTIVSKSGGYDYIDIIAVRGKETLSYRMYAHEYKVLDGVKKITIKQKNSKSVSISWNAVSGATDYILYRCNPLESSKVTSINVSGTSYVDTDITSGVNYTYYVRVYNSDTGTYDDFTNKLTVSYTHKLKAPKITSIKNSAAKKATIKWNGVANAGKYVVYRSTTKNGKYKKVATTAKTTFTDSKLLKGKTYYYKIKSVGKNEVGITVTSGFSGVKQVKIKK